MVCEALQLRLIFEFFNFKSLILRDLVSCLGFSDDRARRSPRKLPTSLKKEERKWVPPKFLPHKYDVKLKNEDKVR